MTNPFSPISPPPELVQQWIGEIWHEGAPVRVAQSDLHLAARAAQWGADQELKACCEWIDADSTCISASELRAARRPKPQSLKEQALTALTRYMTGKTILTNESVDTIRRALEALPND